MADKKKILILYASAGHGHKKAAEAVQEAARADASLDVNCVDILSLTRFGFGQRYRKLYLFMISSVPWLWGFFYYLADIPFVYFFLRPLRRLNNHFFALPLEKTMIDAKPDVVISTHFLSTETAGHLKKKGLIQSRLVTVVTDYLAHCFWLTPENDAYCAGSDETAEDLVRRGVAREKIRVTGIPIEPKFSMELSRDSLRRNMGLSPHAFTALLTSGGVGMAVLEPLLERLIIHEPPAQLLVVCGTNEAMRARLQTKYRGRPSLRLFGFVNNVHELMAASDIVVGKGGGLTITESLAMIKPMVLFGAVPGQETRNVRVVLKRKAAVLARSIADAAQCVRRFQKDSAFYQQTLQAIRSMRRPQAAKSVLGAALTHE